MPWKTMEIEEQKMKFVAAATRMEKSLTALCRRQSDNASQIPTFDFPRAAPYHYGHRGFPRATA